MSDLAKVFIFLGLNWSQNGGVSGNAFGITASSNGINFDPSFSASYTFEYYGKPISITAQEIKSKSDIYPCKDDPNASKAMFFYDSELAYDYMWENSFYINGTPKVELSAWELKTGVLVLPYKMNKVNQSLNNAFKVSKLGVNNGRVVIVNGNKNLIISHIHTHPTLVDNGIGLSKNDIHLQRQLEMPIKILYNRNIYTVNGSYNYQTKTWNYEYLGTW